MRQRWWPGPLEHGLYGAMVTWWANPTEAMSADLFFGVPRVGFGMTVQTLRFRSMGHNFASCVRKEA